MARAWRDPVGSIGFEQRASAGDARVAGSSRGRRWRRGLMEGWSEHGA